MWMSQIVFVCHWRSNHSHIDAVTNLGKMPTRLLNHFMANRGDRMAPSQPLGPNTYNLSSFYWEKKHLGKFSKLDFFLILFRFWWKFPLFCPTHPSVSVGKQNIPTLIRARVWCSKPFGVAGRGIFGIKLQNCNSRHISFKTSCATSRWIAQ